MTPRALGRLCVLVLLAARGIPARASSGVSLSPSSLSFGDQVVGTSSAPKNVTLTNGQSRALAITSITTSKTDYTQTNTCPLSPETLAAGASCTISVTFTPTTTGSRSAGLTINDNAAKSPQVVTLSGNGTSAVTASPTSISFGNQVIGKKSAGHSVTVKNNQATSLTVTSIATGLSDYTYTTGCPLSPSQLAAGGSCTISVFFTPPTTGLRSSTLTVSTSAGIPTVSLSGTGVEPASVSPSSLSFPPQPLGTSSGAQTVTLTNYQSTGLKITSIISSTSDFGYTTTCPLSPATLAAGASCTASVTFSPQATGTRTGTLSFNDNASNTPQAVSLSGTGNPPNLVSIAVTPNNTTLAAGLSQQFTATGTYSDSSTQDLTSSATWNSSTAAVATITSSGLATAEMPGTSTIMATSGAISGSTTLTVNPAALVSIAVTPANSSLVLGTTEALIATGTYTDGSTLIITASVGWSTANPAIATVSSSGSATAVAVGSTNVTATSGAISGSTSITVTPAALVSIAITPALPTIPLGTTQQFTATGTYTDGSTQDVTQSGQWSSDTPAVATISNTAGSQGLATSVATGTANISVSSGSITASTVVTVTTAALVSITVTPAAPSIALGTTEQFTATGNYTDNSTQDLTTTATWASDTVSVATISSSGLATSVAVGTANVSASVGAVSSSTMLTVTGVSLISIAVSPPSASIAAGTTQQFTAMGTYSDGSNQDITQTGHWSSSSLTVATISNTAGMQGLATALTAGSTAISISSSSVSGSATLNVSPAVLTSIAVNPTSANIPLGTSQQFTATGTYSDNSTQDLTSIATWSSSLSSVAVISNTLGSYGLATSAGVGTTTVSASSGEISGSSSLTVSVAALESITVAPASVTISQGSTQQFTATGNYSDGSTLDVTTQAPWSSSLPAVATIDASGLATALSSGGTTIQASLQTFVGTATLTVSAGPPPPPTGLSASAGNAMTILTWLPSNGATSYNVFRSTVSGGSYAFVGSTTNDIYSDSGLTNNTTYFYVVTATGAGGSSGNSDQVSSTPEFVPGFGNIQHIVFIIKENRTFDNLFGTYPGADGATTATISTGQVIALGHTPDRMARDLDHSWAGQFTDVDYNKMDGFDLPQGCNINGDYLCLTQFTQNDIPNYWTYAGNFVLADHMFSSLHGPSFPNHLYTIAAQAGGAADNPHNGSASIPSWGCDAPTGTGVDVLDTNGNMSLLLPCFDFQTLADSLEAAGISWKYYSPAPLTDGYVWNALSAINHIRNSSLWNNVPLDTQFVSDAQNGQLPAVSWLVTATANSEHPPASICEGENWSVQQINAVMQGPLWNSTAIFLTWDDFGGFYDHEPPSSSDEYGLGLRTPLLIISPYAVAGSISHTKYEFSSFLKFVEERFGLQNLSVRDAGANDMLDSFNLAQAPSPPLVLQTRNCPIVSTTSLNYPPQTVNTTSASQTVQITNYATSKLTVQSVATTGNFGSTNTCTVALTQNRECVVTVTFLPTTSGLRSGTVTITDTDSSSPQTVTLNGIGTYVTLSSTTLSFGNAVVGIAAPNKSVTITNKGSASLSISSIAVSGDYTQTNTCSSSLAANSSCKISVTFNPKACGTRYGVLTIVDSDGASPQLVNLTGIGTQISVVPASLTFASQSVGSSSAPQTITLTNLGSSTLAISGISLTGTPQSLAQIILGHPATYPGVPTPNYVQSTNCGPSLPAGTSCSITVTFTPTLTGTINASIAISDGEADSPQVVSITGTGQ